MMARLIAIMHVLNLTASENMSGSIQSAILGLEVFQRVIMRLPSAERVGTAFATRPLRIEMRQH